MLRLRNLESGYSGLKVLRRLTIHVSQGEIVTIIGANGAGKTTLLKTIAGLIKASSGEILFEGRQIFSPMSVRENLMLGAYPQYKRKRNNEIEHDTQRVFDLFPRLRERKSQLAGTLSGGEQQMLSIARALMSRPRLIMMDEPSMGLAPMIVKDIFSTIVKLREEGNTVLLVEQNAKAALSIADRGYVLETGRIMLEETATELLSNMDVQRAYLGRDLDAEGKLGG